MRPLRIDEAGPADDAAIRALLGEATVPGEVALSFQREPSYFAACAHLGHRSETFVARDGSTIAGVVSVAMQRLFVQGAASEVAYLSQLRVAPAYQGRALVGRGLRALRQRLQAQDVPGAYATISLGNEAAERVLCGRHGQRQGRFEAITTIDTLTYAATPRAHRPRDVQVAPASARELDEVIAFSQRHGPRRQLYPQLASTTFAKRGRGLQPEDLLLARCGGQLVGLMAVWDQSAWRQTVVRAYGPRLRRLKWLLDAGRLARGARPLPPAGAALHVACASLLCVMDDDPSVTTALLAAGVRAAHGRGAHTLALAVAREDPLLAIVKRWRHVSYTSRLYALALADASFAQRLEGVRFIDVGSL